jgi:hypothetical protein
VPEQGISAFVRVIMLNMIFTPPRAVKKSDIFLRMRVAARYSLA